MSSTSSSVSTVSTSSSTQVHLLPSAFSIKPTIQIKSQLPQPISTTIPNNSLNTSASSLSTKTRPFLTSSNKFAALSTEVQPSVPLPKSSITISNREPSNTSKISQGVKENQENRRKCTKIRNRNKNGST
ncbi:uncharacterized protein TNCV_63121 [Trichonephila clavipes]|nr:uncharacterized protein TNCV_63121 [Trichonephila clavipes]